MSKFDWASVAEEVDPISKLAALYWYCSEYHSGQNSWQYSVLSKSKYIPGPTHNDILDCGDHAAMAYYQHLVSLFEENWDGLATVNIYDGGIPYRYDIVILGVVGEFDSLEELTREISTQIYGECLAFYPSIMDVYNILEGEFTYPLVIEGDEGSYYEEDFGLNFCFNFGGYAPNRKKVVNPCLSCKYNTGEPALPCAVNPMGYGVKCSDYEVA